MLIGAGLVIAILGAAVSAQYDTVRVRAPATLVGYFSSPATQASPDVVELLESAGEAEPLL